MEPQVPWRFAFEPLPAGEYRLSVSGHEVRRVRLAPGDAREELFELGGDEVEILLLEDGAPLRQLDGAILFVLDPGSVEHGSHYTARQVGPGRLRVRRPAGPALLLFDRRGPSTDRFEVAWLDRLSGEAVEVRVDANELVIARADGALDGPPVRVALVGLGAIDIGEVWMHGDEIELAWTRDAEGRQMVRGLPEGAPLRVIGVDSEGRSAERELVVTGPELVWR